MGVFNFLQFPLIYFSRLHRYENESELRALRFCSVFGCFFYSSGHAAGWGVPIARVARVAPSGRMAQQLSHPHQIIRAEDQHPAQAYAGGAPLARPP